MLFLKFRISTSPALHVRKIPFPFKKVYFPEKLSISEFIGWLKFVRSGSSYKSVLASTASHIISDAITLKSVGCNPSSFSSVVTANKHIPSLALPNSWIIHWPVYLNSKPLEKIPTYYLCVIIDLNVTVKKCTLIFLKIHMDFTQY